MAETTKFQQLLTSLQENSSEKVRLILRNEEPKVTYTSLRAARAARTLDPTIICALEDLTDENIRELADVLASNTKVTSLNFEELDPQVFQRIMTIFTEAGVVNNDSCIRKLSLNGVEVNADSVQSIAHMLAQSTSINELNFSLCKFEAKSAQALVNMLAQDSYLDSLTLLQNQIDATGFKTIVKTAIENKSIHSLNILDKINIPTFIGELAESLKHNTSIHKLNLYNTNMNDNAAESLAEMLVQNSTLLELTFDTKANSPAIINDIEKEIKLNQECINILEKFRKQINTTTNIRSLENGPMSLLPNELLFAIFSQMSPFDPHPNDTTEEKEAKEKFARAAPLEKKTMTPLVLYNPQQFFSPAPEETPTTQEEPNATSRKGAPPHHK